MHTPYPSIEEDMKFTKVLIVKQKLEEIVKQKPEIELICSVWTLEIKYMLISIIFSDLHTFRTSHGKQISFW
jgi:hypothetical protein